MLRKTKIICTMGPSTDTVEKIKELIEAGMNIARLNFSHGTRESHGEMIKKIRQACKETNRQIAILIDLKGPEIRTGFVEDNQKINLVKGNKIIITTEDVICNNERISVNYKTLNQEVKKGTHIYIADGVVDLKVVNINGTEIECIINAGAEIGSKKNVNVRGVRVDLPAITDDDKKNILFGIQEEVDFIAGSFIRQASDVLEIKQIIDENHSDVHVISKIEDEEGVDNIDKIIQVSDGVMVARGDLGVQIDAHEVPLVQKRIISKCNEANKPVITATQMLDSMTNNSRPTRAESNDVANAIFDGTDAVMLSGETAAGKYPELAVKVMNDICMSIESSNEYKERCRFVGGIYKVENNIAGSLAKSAFSIADSIKANAILTPTMHGTTPKLISKFRPVQPVIAVVTSEKVQRKLIIYWGIYPIISEFVSNSEEMMNNAIKSALDIGYVNNFNKIVIVAGIPINSPIMINTIKVHIICNVLENGRKGLGKIVSGRIILAENIADAALKIKGNGDEILVTKVLDESFRPLIPKVAAIILEDYSMIPDDMIRMLNPEITLISGVDNALKTFEELQVVSVDGEQKLIYEGVVASSKKGK